MRQLFFIIFRLNVHDFFVGLNEISQLPINHFFGGIPVSRQGKNEKIFDEYKMWWKNVFETRMKKPIRGINKFIITFCAQCSLSMKWNAWMQMQKVGFSWSLDRATVTQLNFIQVFELKSVFFWESENIFFVPNVPKLCRLQLANVNVDILVDFVIKVLVGLCWGKHCENLDYLAETLTRHTYCSWMVPNWTLHNYFPSEFCA